MSSIYQTDAIVDPSIVTITAVEGNIIDVIEVDASQRLFLELKCIQQKRYMRLRVKMYCGACF
jgi:hypothetical protein